MDDANDFTWVKDYRISSRIATGGMAEVYFAWRFDRETGEKKERVAIKKLLPHLVKDRAIVQMFVNEAKIIAQIHHPNVVRILDLGNESGEWFIAMELLEGRSFSDLRTRAAEMGKRVPLGITLRILTDACRGLDAAHRARDEEGRELRIVHRDFTPDNVHVGVDGIVKVIDFGIAKAANVGAGTEPGTLKGKFFYMSPEMISGHAVDHRADLFAAGVMLYEQLCGRRPFTGSYSDEVLSRIAEGKPRRPTEFDPSVPVALENICLKALQRNPNDRFPSLTEFVDAIAGIGGEAQLATPKQVGGYVSELFPPDEDPKRQTLRKALIADPSMPHASMGDVQEVADEPLPPPFPLPAPPKSQPRAQAPAELVAAPRPARSVPLKAMAGVFAAVLLIGGGAAVTLRLRGNQTPDELIARARAAPTPADKAKLLAGLGEDPRASASDLDTAAQLLEAAEAWNELLDLSAAYQKKVPKQATPYLFEARAAAHLRQGKRADAALDRASQVAPNSSAVDLQRASLRELQGDVSGAIEALGRALKKNPRNLEAAYRLGYLQSQAGRLEEAEATLKDAIARRYDAESAAELAFVKFRQGQPAEARTLLKAALQKERGLAIGYYYLGAVLFRQGDAVGAEKAYRDADRLNPKDPRALAALCQVLAQRKDDGAVAETKKAMATRFPTDSNLPDHCKAP